MASMTKANYSICSKISNTSILLFLIKKYDQIFYLVYPDRTAPSDLSLYCLQILSCQVKTVEILVHFTINKKKYQCKSK